MFIIKQKISNYTSIFKTLERGGKVVTINCHIFATIQFLIKLAIKYNITVFLITVEVAKSL